MDINRLLQIGGTEWQNPDGNKHYIYFKNFTELVGLETEHYKSGSVKKATLNSKPISNGKATKMIKNYHDSKLWWDCNTKSWGYRTYDVDLIKDVIDAIKHKIKGD